MSPKTSVQSALMADGPAAYAALAALAIRAGRGGFSELPRWMGTSAWNSLLDALLAAVEGTLCRCLSEKSDSTRPA